MITVTAIYPRQEGATFDFDYYTNSHLPLVASVWRDYGLSKVTGLKGVSAVDGSEAPYLAIALLEFESIEALQKALAAADSARIMADLGNYTTIPPILQVNEILS